MKLPEWTKKQAILIGALLGVLLCTVIFLVAVLARPADPAESDEPDYETENEAIDYVGESSVSVAVAATPPPDLSLKFLTDEAHPMPEDGAVLKLI